MKPAFVLLTRGDRPAELARAIESIKSQTGLESSEIVVVANGCTIDNLDGVTVVTSAENLGVPGGRNLGLASCTGDALFFLDDDASYGTSDVAKGVLDAFELDGRLGIVSLRVTDPASGKTARRHVPRLGESDPTRSSLVTAFLGGASAVRRAVFERVGPFPAEFFYAHEETDLAWRALDAGFRIVYRGDLVVNHPLTTPSRHPEGDRLAARNRVFLARRRLPIPINLIYVLVWVIVSLLRTAGGERRRAVIKGTREGMSQPAGTRAPMRWKTVWQMTRLGRPPIV